MGNSRIGTGARVNRWIWTLAAAATLGHAADNAFASSPPLGLVPAAGAYSTVFTLETAQTGKAPGSDESAEAPTGMGALAATASPELAFANPLLW